MVSWAGAPRVAFFPEDGNILGLKHPKKQKEKDLCEPDI